MRIGTWLPLLLAATTFEAVLPSAFSQPSQVERRSHLPLGEDLPDLTGAEEYLASRLNRGRDLTRLQQDLKQLQQIAKGLDPKALAKLTDGGDLFFSWMVRRFINVVPDLDSYSWTGYLSEGFSVPLECLAMNLLTTVGYLLPWFVLSFYLMRSREVAA